MNKYTPAVDLIAHGVPNKSIASACGFSISTANKLPTIFSAAKRKDIETLKNYYESHKAFTEAVCEYMGVTIADNAEAPAAEPAKTAAPDNTAIYLSQMLAEVKDLNENMRCLIDADLPKHFNDLLACINALSSEMVRTINANADVIEGDLKQQTQFLDNIRFNTKKLK